MSYELSANGAAAAKDPALVDGIKRELAHREHAYPDGKVRPLDGLARLAQAALIAFAASKLTVLSLLAAYNFFPAVLPVIFYQWGDGGFNAGYLFDWADAIISITAFVMVGRVTYRAMKNLFTINSPAAEMPPGWTIGWYFVPVAALWQPVMGMSQIWRGSHAAVGEPAPGGYIPLWWGCWIAMSVPNWVSQVTAEAAPPVSFVMWALGAALGITAALTLRRIIARIADCQARLLTGGIATVFD